jgi:hypothetical protein
MKRVVSVASRSRLYGALVRLTAVDEPYSKHKETLK